MKATITKKGFKIKKPPTILESSLTDEEKLVHQYFALLGNGKVNAVLDMFIEGEAIVYEPFSKRTRIVRKRCYQEFSSSCCNDK